MINHPTANISFREINENDLENFISFYGDETNMKYINGKALTKEECRAKLVDILKDNKENSPLGTWAGELKQTGEFVGVFLVKDFPGLEHTGVGYGLLPKFWGKGLASEACKALVQFGTQLGFKYLSAVTHPENFPSIRVLEKAGFKFIKEVNYHNPLAEEQSPSSIFELKVE